MIGRGIDEIAINSRGWSQLVTQYEPDVVLLWLTAEDSQGFYKVLEPDLQRQALGYVGTSSSVLGVTWGNSGNDWLKSLRQPLFVAWPWTIEGSEAPRLYRLRSWFRSRGIAVNHEGLQLNTYFAASVADHALTHLLDRFSRDYFFEVIEHETENGLNPGHYPRMSLGPGQRFAVKGCYVLKVDQWGWQRVSEWR